MTEKLPKKKLKQFKWDAKFCEDLIAQARKERRSQSALVRFAVEIYLRPELSENIKEKCMFSVEIQSEKWDIFEKWFNPITRGPVWYTGKTIRDGVNFERTFSPEEIYFAE